MSGGDPAPTDLARRCWPEVGDPVLAVPVGATEQHGPHLPLDTDTTIAVELCRRLAACHDGVAVTPPVAFGSSGEHAGFPGTLSIGAPALELLLVELVRSADHFPAVVLVNAHGGNLAPLTAAARTLRSEGRRVLAWSPRGRPDDTHAGRTETSVLLRLRPADVRLTRAEPGNTTPVDRLWDTLVRDGVRAVSANGVLGDPAGADAEEGERQLGAWTDDLRAAVRSRFGG